tara:strand:- start:2154 stop:5108 length:2955 start_codon:yes stop_codon:yes gene_type:complete
LVENNSRLAFKPVFYGSKDSYDRLDWQERRTEIKDSEGGIIFQKDVIVPSSWTDLATKVVSSKYLLDDKNGINEIDVRDLVKRVGGTIANEAVSQGLIYAKDKENYGRDLMSLTAGQFGSFNSPVWFNQGLFHVYNINEGKNPGEESSHWAYDFQTKKMTNEIDAYERPQNSACFIQSIGDNMEEILGQSVKEGMLFKFGSGTGTNFSSLRGYGESLSGGGIASGMISFMGFLDHIAGSVRSGGKTRRAAKMVINDCDHPDILRFVNWKVNEEKKALWLCANPDWGPRNPFDLESEAYKTVNGQNGNNTIRVTDKFMQAVKNDEEWDLHFRTAYKYDEEVEISLDNYQDDRNLPDKRFIKRLTNKRKVIMAKSLWNQIARAAYVSGDPAIQYDDNINKWNTCANSGRINASNPCSEFMALDDSACNLASLNLMKFREGDRSFNVDKFKGAIRTAIIAQETLVDQSSYPSEIIAQNSHDYRFLGLGYANMGSLLMSFGIPYDSYEGQAVAGSITALMTGEAYKVSAEIASKKGAFNKFEENKEPMLKVIGLHKEHLQKINKKNVPKGLESILDSAVDSWSKARNLGDKFGYRNAQVTLLAPTGTIGFMMDCDTTGVEPMGALQSEKGLVGGGKLELPIAECFVQGLSSLGYEENLQNIIKNYVLKNNTVIGAPGLKEEHYGVFATAFDPQNTIAVDGHLGMMAAVQPFLSGAISKTVNLPKGSSLEDISLTYEKGWKLGLKSVALYVDGSKGMQPIVVKSIGGNGEKLKWGDRDRLPSPCVRPGWNVDIQGTGIHIQIGEYNNRKPSESPGDFFIEFGSSGSPFSAAYTSFAKELSRNRQRGASLQEIIKHNLGAVGTISGMTDHPFIKSCSSIEDFLAKLIKLEYLGETDHCQVKLTPEQLEELRCNELAKRNGWEHYWSRIKSMEAMMEKGKVKPIKPLLEDETPEGSIKSGTPFCTNCGTKTILSGANCYKCDNCGHSPGCG